MTKPTAESVEYHNKIMFLCFRDPFKRDKARFVKDWQERLGTHIRMNRFEVSAGFDPYGGYFG